MVSCTLYIFACLHILTCLHSSRCVHMYSSYFQSFPALNCSLDYDWSVSSTSQRLKSSNIQEKVKCSKCFGSKSRKHLPKQLETIRLAQGLHWRIRRYKSFKPFNMSWPNSSSIPFVQDSARAASISFVASRPLEMVSHCLIAIRKNVSKNQMNSFIAD